MQKNKNTEKFDLVPWLVNFFIISCIVITSSYRLLPPSNYLLIFRTHFLQTHTKNNKFNKEVLILLETRSQEIDNLKKKKETGK